MEFLDNKTPKEELEKIHALVLEGTSANKEEPVEVNEHGHIDANDEAANNFYIFWFTPVTYML